MHCAGGGPFPVIPHSLCGGLLESRMPANIADERLMPLIPGIDGRDEEALKYQANPQPA
jgi:hypothetical protein